MIKSVRLHIFFFVLILLVNPSFAQEDHYVFSHLDVNDGLSENTIKCIIKDRNGFIWFGTSTGLNRYDGYEFEGMLKERTFNIVWVTKDKPQAFEAVIKPHHTVNYSGEQVIVNKE